MSTITPLPDPPSRRDPINFAARADEFLAALQQMVNEFNAAAFGSGAELASVLASASSASDGDALLAVKQPLTGAEGRTQHEKNRDIKSFSDFCQKNKTFATMTAAEAYAAIQAAWSSALVAGHDLVNWGETIDIGENNYPWRQGSINPASLLDCGNITIYGVGPKSVFKTTSADGADVFQLNGVKNLHFRNLAITASLTGSSASGSNGISVTGGYDNLTFDSIWITNCPGLDKGTNIDGGAGLTVQCDAAVAECGYLRATNIYVKGCSYAFAVQPGLPGWLSKRAAIEVDNLVAIDCFTAVSAGSSASTGAIPSGSQINVRVRAQAIDCQRDLMLARTHGGVYEVAITTTKTAPARRLNPSGAAWFAADTTVEALRCAYAKNAKVVISGNKGACDYKASIGGSSAGSSGLSGATEHCDLYLDIAGTSSTADIAAIDLGGNNMTSSRLFCTATTASSLPDLFYTSTGRNDLQPGALNTGSFTATLTGVTGTVTATFVYSIVDDMVTMRWPDITGDSTSTGATVVGLPPAVQPSIPQVPIVCAVNNGVDVISRADITGGTMTLYNGTSFSFTASGLKGLRSGVVSFRRSS